MIHRIRGTVEYEGGRVDHFDAGSVALAEWELYAMRHGYPVGEGAPPMLSMLVVAHYALGIAEGFDVWRRSLVDVDFDTEETVPPTLPVATAAE
jgi:hypothetical protein